MASDALFHFARIAGPGREWQSVKQGLERDTLPALSRAGGTCWGIWQGLFGLRSNELIMVTCWPPGAFASSVLRAAWSAVDASSALRAALAADVAVVDSADFVATLRPADATPRTRPGLYVFRFFDVRARDVDEIVALSGAAWTTFESSASYASEPQALFRLRDATADAGRMLLLTWYDGFQSWQASRAPHPDALANFQRRAALTGGTVAYATRLA